MIQVDVDIPLTPDQVWDRLTSRAHIQKWWGKDVQLDRHKGGKFSEAWTDDDGKARHTSGFITAVEDDTRLQLNWQDDGWAKPTRVEFILSALKKGETRLCLQHSGWEIFTSEAERRKVVDDYNIGWRELMEKFRNYCANG